MLTSEAKVKNDRANKDSHKYRDQDQVQDHVASLKRRHLKTFKDQLAGHSDH